MKNSDKYPLKAIREHCLDCADGNVQYVKYCPTDGVHSSRCPLWPFRFGVMPTTAAKRHGIEFVVPSLMPPANANLEDLVRGETQEPS
jgi:hypothetical protein